MNRSYTVLISIFSILILYSFNSKNDIANNAVGIEKYERLALQSNKPGRVYTVDLTKIEGCNKSRVRYLGLVSTNAGKKFKLLTCTVVQGKSCRGSCAIKVYDTANKFIGRYSVGMPYDLPDTLISNKLVYTTASEGCPARKGFSIRMADGLPTQFFIPCSADGGDIYSFSD